MNNELYSFTHLRQTCGVCSMDPVSMSVFSPSRHWHYHASKQLTACWFGVLVCSVGSPEKYSEPEPGVDGGVHHQGGYGSTCHQYHFVLLPEHRQRVCCSSIAFFRCLVSTSSLFQEFVVLVQSSSS